MKRLFGPIIILAALAGPAAAERAPCRIQVDGHTYARGRCTVDRQPGGGLSLSGDNRRGGSKVTANLSSGSGVTVEATWSGRKASNDASTSLGTLVRQGECWANGRARICLSR